MHGLKEFLKVEGYKHLTEVEGRGLCGIARMAFTVGLFYGLTEYSYVGRYCYPSAAEAIEGLLTWDGKGDPSGNWIKHKGKIEYTNENHT